MATQVNNTMSNPQNRVLIRIGARELTAEEVQRVTGGAAVLRTLVCTFATATGPGDGDGCSDHDVY